MTTLHDDVFKMEAAVNDALGSLNNTLRRELVESGYMSIKEWNEKIAPALMGVVSGMIGSRVHARTFRLHPSVVDAPKKDREGESIDICSRCMKTFVVQRNTLKQTCKEIECPLRSGDRS